MNWKAYCYVENIILNNFTERDLYLVYKYLLTIQPTQMQIVECAIQAQKFVEKEKRDHERKLVQEMNVNQYTDFRLEDLL